MKTGRNPLSASPISTAIAKPRPSARATLVAPMLPLPTLRRSTPRARATMSPVGIDPTR